MTSYKGLDDLLAANLKPRRLQGSAVDAFFAATRARLFAVPAESEVAPATPEVKPPGDARPPFPIDVFPEKVARYARRGAEAMGCPVDFLGVSILVVSGAAIGAARCVQVKGGWVEMPGM